MSAKGARGDTQDAAGGPRMPPQAPCALEAQQLSARNCLDSSCSVNLFEGFRLPPTPVQVVGLVTGYLGEAIFERSTD